MNRKTILILIFLSGLNAQISRYDAKPTLAVFNFESKAVSDENVTLMLDSLIYELYKTNAFIMVEEHQINEIILEQKYDNLDCIVAHKATSFKNIILRFFFDFWRLNIKP